MSGGGRSALADQQQRPQAHFSHALAIVFENQEHSNIQKAQAASPQADCRLVISSRSPHENAHRQPGGCPIAGGVFPSHVALARQ